MDYSTYSIKQLAAFISQNLQLQGFDVVIVGGLAVEFYTHNKYLTVDIDMIDRSYQTKALTRAMENLGFIKEGKNFTHPTTRYFVEFPSAPLEVAGEIIEHITMLETDYGTVPIINLEDIIKDRLAAYLHWGDIPSLFQALCLMVTHNIPAKSVEPFLVSQGSAKIYELFYERLKIVKKLNSATLDNIETALADSILLEKITKNF